MTADALQDRLAKMIVEAKETRANNIAADPDAEQRFKARHCKGCHYSGPYATGQAFTSWKCRCCNTGGYHHNTGTPAVCTECSNRLGLCVECGDAIN